MHRTHLALAVALLATLPLSAAAQATSATTPGNAYLPAPDGMSIANVYAEHQRHAAVGPRITTINGCPVGFSAGHSRGLTALRSTDANAGTPSQSLNLAMANTNSRDVVSAQITVHGLSAHYRLTPLNGDTAANGDLAKQVVVDLAIGSGGHADTDFRVYGFTSVQRIDLDSLTYADGSTWTPAKRDRCSIVPNGIMLVAAAQ